MAQMNLHIDPTFEADLARLRQVRGLRSKSEAVRLAVRETLERSLRSRRKADFASWLGLGLSVPPNAQPRFTSDDDLWGENRGH